MNRDAREALRMVRPYAAVVLGFLGGCVRWPPPPSPQPPAETASCSTMCASFREAGCRAGFPSPRLGITCEKRCEDQLASGAVKPPIACVTAAAGRADAIRACGQRCLP